ncbi:MAG: UbiA family prenyltransferase [Dehalococcoidia bacterium]|nr:UbiA family prenyltransferase [Dehalococcoidia bacterium]
MLSDYLNVLKPKETSLLVFIGACSALVAAAAMGGLFPAGTFILTVLAITCGSAGANGLTNYLDRDVDALMSRTCKRALPSGRIKPPWKVLPMIAVLIVAGLILAWLLSPICFVIGLVGVLASGILRKTVSCTYFGIIAGSSPVLIGWYAISQPQAVTAMPVLFFCLIAAWTPLHVWTLMLANRSDYEGAGLHYFPLSWPDSKVIILLAVLSLALSAFGVLIYFLSGFLHWLYLSVAVLMSLLMVSASIRLLVTPNSRNAWMVYKLSAFPYLGIIFLVMVIDSWFL